jgi:methionyl aminopeptidase
MQFKKYTESFGYGVVRELVGHGRAKMHEDPEMPNYGKRGRGKLLLGMVVAIEPMINRGPKTSNSLKTDGQS